MNIVKPRGTKDRFGQEFDKYEIVLNAAIKTAQRFGFRQVLLPIFERAELFHRQNEASDIVKKELYEFFDRGARKMALRPEMTAAMLRMVGENKLLATQPLPIKLFTHGSVFRYERPQTGRQREFYQFDVEIIAGNLIYDVVDVISFADCFLTDLNLRNKTLLKINYLGSINSRKLWIKSLQDYFLPFKNELSQLSQERLLVNPLRILDDKTDSQLDFVKNAPKIEQFLANAEKEIFAKVLSILDRLKIAYVIDHSLVRGLDYYTGTVFEFVQNESTSQQATLIAGGEYDGLVAELTGKNHPGIGLAIGMDRCLELLDIKLIEKKHELDAMRILLIGLDVKRFNDLYVVCSQWQKTGIPINFNSSVFKIDKAIKLATLLNYRYLAIVGTSELNNQTVVIKDLSTHQQTVVLQTELWSWWQKRK